MQRRRWAWFGAFLLLACIASLGAGALVREQLRVGQGFSLISSAIYLVRDQHKNNPANFLSPMSTLALWSVFLIGVIVLIRSAHTGTTGLSVLPELVGGLFIGGALANLLEAQTLGSVTDFLEIDTSGIFSAGDIGMEVATSLFPIAAIQVAQARHRTGTQVLRTGLVLYAAVVTLSILVLHDYAQPVLVTTVTGGYTAIWLMMRVISPRSHGTAPPRPESGRA